MTNKTLLLLTLVSSILYFIKLPISPIYIIIPIVYFIFLLKMKHYTFHKEDSTVVIIIIITVLYTIVYQPFLMSNVGMYLNTIISLINILVIYFTARNLDKSEFEVTLYNFLKISIFILILELTYRIINPIYIEDILLAKKDLFIYPYKRNSIMFVDSNYTAILILTLISLFHLNLIKIKKYKYTYVLLIILLLLTFSRSAILVYILVCIIQKLNQSISFNKYKNFNRMIVFLTCISLLFFIILLFDKQNITDGSFQSKFKLLSLMLEISNKKGIVFFLFGGGIGNSHNLIGMGAHNILVLLYFEYGIIFSIFLISILLFSIIKEKNNLYIFWIIFFVNGMSLSFFLAFVFIPLGLRLARNNGRYTCLNKN